ncbi:hypothetical protein AAFC00_007144 [Neodothiora populina]
METKAPTKVFTACKSVTSSDRAIGARRVAAGEATPCFSIYNERFRKIIGESPTLAIEIELAYPFAHEAGVYLPDLDKIFVTSNQYHDTTSGTTAIDITEIKRQSSDGQWIHKKVERERHGIALANGGVNYRDGVLFCDQGDHDTPSRLVYVHATLSDEPSILLDNYHGRSFNSMNDVVVKSDGSIWFTDPIYGFEQGIRPEPQLPSQVYRFDPATGDVRVVADGFGRPNGISFSPDEETVYITDTEWIHGDGDINHTRASTIYAFDVILRGGADFLANRRVFAMADAGIPDGIKCDTDGNVYSGCGDGLNVWGPDGTLLGKMIVPGGVANFCFARKGEILLLNEDKFWVAAISEDVRGALLR